MVAHVFPRRLHDLREVRIIGRQPEAVGRAHDEKLVALDNAEFVQFGLRQNHPIGIPDPAERNVVSHHNLQNQRALYHML